MKKIDNMFDLKKKESKNNKRRVKEVTKCKDKEINELRIKSILGISAGLGVVTLGALINQLGIELTSEEINATLANPNVFSKLMSVFSYMFYGVGGAITVLNGKKALERKKEINELKEEREKIKSLYKTNTISKEEKEDLKRMKVKRIR